MASAADMYGMTGLARTALRDRSSAVQNAQSMVQHSVNAAAHSKGALSPQRLAAAHKVAQDFEAVFLSEMLEYGFQGISSNPVTGGGFADDTYRSMQVQEYGKIMARAGGIGIADHVMRALVERQEV